MVSIGHGWDVRADQSVSGMTPWTPGTIEEMTSDWDNQQKEVFFEKETDSSQRDERLDIEANLGVNVLSGLVSVEAGGKYMTEEKMTSTSVRFVLDYDAKHHFTSFDFLPPVDLPDFCSSGHLAEDGSPTHVVTSVQYGTKAFILFEQEVFIGETEEEIAAWMQFAVATGVVDVNASFAANYTNEHHHNTSEISLHFLGNTLNVNTPSRVEEVHATIESLDESSKENPQPVSFRLTRIDRICSAADVVFASIGDPILEQLARILRWFADIQLRTTTLKKNSIAGRQVLMQALDGPGSFGDGLDSANIILKDTLRTLLVDVRSKKTDDKALQTVIDEVNNGHFEEYKSGTFLDYFEREVNSFNIFYNVSETDNIDVENAEGSIQRSCMAGGSKDTYIFILNVLPTSNLATEFFEDRLDTTQRWMSDENMPGIDRKFGQFMRKAQQSNPDSSCFVVDVAPSDPVHPVTFKVVSMFGDVMTDHDQLPEVPDHLVSMDTARCRWVNALDTNVMVACAADELATGSCGGRTDAVSHYDCGGGTAVHSLHCCPSSELPLKVDENNCTRIHDSSGRTISCYGLDREEHLSVHRACSSGLYRWCDYSGEGDWTYNMADCCPAGLSTGQVLGPRGDADCGEWKYGDAGENLMCDGDAVVVAKCGWGGSGGIESHYCPGWKAHGIKCCNMYVL